MNSDKLVTVSGRVSSRTRQLAEMAAKLRTVTLSRFVAHAIGEAARRELLLETERLSGIGGGADA